MAKTKARKQFEKEYDKVYKRIQKYIERFSQIGWEIPKRLVPPVKEKATKKQYEKFKEIYIKDFRKELKKLQSEEVGKVLKGKEAKAVGKEREKQYIELKREAKRKPKQRVQRIKTLEQPIQPAPQITFVGHLREIIENLPDERWLKGRVVKNVTPIKQELIEILEENLEDYGQDYVQHLLSKQEMLDDSVYGVTYASEEEQYERSITNLVVLVNYDKPLSSAQAEKLSEFGEYSGYNPAYYG